MEQNTFLFDFDGTLVDSMPSFIGAVLRILDDNKIKYNNDIVKIVTPLGYTGTAKYFQTLGLNKPVSEIVDLMYEYLKNEYENNIVAKESVVETLKKMHGLGYCLNVLTASPHALLDSCLKRIGIFDIFNNVWSCDDFNTTKADKKIYELCAIKLCKSVNEIVFVDDNINAIRTAKSAGMLAYGIYDVSSKDYIDDMQNVACKYVMKFSDLL